MDVRFCVIGALVPDLLLNEPPDQATLDADVVVFVPDLETFERIKTELVGFQPTKYPYRLQHESGGRADILPYSEALARDGVLRLEPDYVFNMAGFDHVARAIIDITLASRDTVPVVRVPLYVLLKLVALPIANSRRISAACCTVFAIMRKTTTVGSVSNTRERPCRTSTVLRTSLESTRDHLSTTSSGGSSARCWTD